MLIDWKEILDQPFILVFYYFALIILLMLPGGLGFILSIFENERVDRFFRDFYSSFITAAALYLGLITFLSIIVLYVRLLIV